MKRLAPITFGLLVLASLSTVAMAQNEMEIRSQGTKPYTIEVKPLTGLSRSPTAPLLRQAICSNAG